MLAQDSSTTWPALLRAGKIGKNVTIYYSFHGSVPWVIRNGVAQAAQYLSYLLTSLFSGTYAHKLIKIRLLPKRAGGIELKDAPPLGTTYDLGPGTLADSTGVGDIRISAMKLDGSGNTLAETYFPAGVLNRVGNYGGDMTFDTSEKWGFDHRLRADEYSVLYVALHELFHAIGMDHSPENTKQSILVPYVNPGYTYRHNYKGKTALLHHSNESMTTHGFLLGNEWGVVVQKRVLRGLKTDKFSATYQLRFNPRNVRVRSASINASGTLFLVDTSGKLLTRSGPTGFKRLVKKQIFSHVSAGARVLAVNSRGKVVDALSGATMRGTTTSKVMRVSISAGRLPLRTTHGGLAVVWTVQTNGTVMSGTIPMKGTSMALHHVLGPNKLIDIGVGFMGRMVVAIDVTGKVWRRTHTSFHAQANGKAWKHISTPIPMQRVHVSAKGDISVISRTGNLFVRTGINAHNMNGTGWKISSLKNVSCVAINPQ
jgi:hypothetical protein